MDKHSSEQRFCKSNMINVICEKTGALVIMELGLMAGRQSGRPLGRRICCKVKKIEFCIFDF